MQLTLTSLYKLCTKKTVLLHNELKQTNKKCALHYKLRISNIPNIELFSSKEEGSQNFIGMQQKYDVQPHGP